jgi:hypothetical protein
MLKPTMLETANKRLLDIIKPIIKRNNRVEIRLENGKLIVVEVGRKVAAKVELEE